MSAPQNLLISLEERHANGILAGTKTVELRRRSMHVAVGAKVWIYIKLPVGSVVGCANVISLHTLAPSTLWSRFGAVSGLQRQEFFSYFSGLSKAFALGLGEPVRLAKPITLNELREVSGGFHPPQFFANIASDSPLLRALNGALPIARSRGQQRELELDLV